MISEVRYDKIPLIFGIGVIAHIHELFLHLKIPNLLLVPNIWISKKVLLSAHQEPQSSVLMCTSNQINIIKFKGMQMVAVTCE